MYTKKQLKIYFDNIYELFLTEGYNHIPYSIENSSINIIFIEGYYSCRLYREHDMYNINISFPRKHDKNRIKSLLLNKIKDFIRLSQSKQDYYDDYYTTNYPVNENTIITFNEYVKYNLSS